MADFDSLVDDSQTQKNPDSASAPQMFDDMQDDNQAQQEPTQNFDDLKDDSEQPKTSTIGAIAEGIGQGTLGPIPGYIENKISELGGQSDLSYDAQNARREENPGAFEVGKFGGNMAQLAMLPEFKLLGYGSKAVNLALQMNLIAGEDELSNSMLGHGDPLSVIAARHIAATGSGLLLGKAAQWLSNKAALAASQKYGSTAVNYAAGIGHALEFPESTGTYLGDLQQLGAEGYKTNLLNDSKAFEMGQKLTKETVMPSAKKAVLGGSASAGAWAGATIAGTPGAIIGEKAGEYAGKYLGEKIVPKFAQKVIGPMVMKMVGDGSVQNMAEAINHGVLASRGAQIAGKAINNLFESSENSAIDYATVSDHDRKKMDDHIDQGGINTQLEDAKGQMYQKGPRGFAQGGEITNQLSPDKLHPIEGLQDNNPIAKHWPDQNIALNASKSRVYNYLNSLKPRPDPMKLPYDAKSDNKQQKKEYEKAVNMTFHPLNILNKVKDGSLTPQDMSHFTKIWPEIYGYISKGITKKIAENQIDESKKPPFYMRQALSLFLGSHLESSFLPQNIAAAQGVFAQQNMQKQQVAQKNAAGLQKVADNMQTSGQGSTKRLNKD